MLLLLGDDAVHRVIPIVIITKVAAVLSTRNSRVGPTAVGVKGLELALVLLRLIRGAKAANFTRHSSLELCVVDEQLLELGKLSERGWYGPRKTSLVEM